MILNKLLSGSDEVTRKVLESIDKNQSLLLTYFNQHCFNVYCEDKDYRNLIEQKFNAYQADLGIYLALKLFLKNNISKIAGTDLNISILNELIANKIHLVIVGGEFEESFVMKEAKKRGINLVYYKNGFFDETEVDYIIRQLDSFDVQVIFVGMGVPKQELFAEKLSRSMKNKVIICVGIFFEYYFGKTKRAPVFMQKIGLEWMFRLITEPKRLWRRYLIGIPEFIFRVIKMKLGSKVT